MKTTILLWCVLSIVWAGCRSETTALPQGIWSEGCAELSPYQDGYRLRGLCCEYVLIPGKSLITTGGQAVKATYHTFTGAGFSNTPIDVYTLQTTDGKLFLRYTLPYTNSPTVFQLTPGPAQKVCQCGCD